MALIVALWRTVRGVVGPWQERFDGFVRPPRAVLAYLRAVLAQREQRHLNHNPLGGWMVLVLLACALLAGASGALYDTDLLWGDPALYRVHQWSGWAFAGLVPLHLAGVLFTSWRQRENLIGAMVTGRKRAPGPDDVA